MTTLLALLGLLILASPLLIKLGIIVLAFWLPFKLTKNINSKRIKLAGRIGFVALAFVVLFGQEIVGKIYLAHICAKESGFKVYKSVVVPEEFWDAQGTAIYWMYAGTLNTRFFSNRFEWVTYPDAPYVDSFIKIEKLSSKLMDRDDKKVSVLGEKLGERVTFALHNDWLSRTFSISPITGTSCEYGPQFGREQEERFVAEVFKKAKAAQ